MKREEKICPLLKRFVSLLRLILIGSGSIFLLSLLSSCGHYQIKASAKNCQQQNITLHANSDPETPLPMDFSINRKSYSLMGSLMKESWAEDPCLLMAGEGEKSELEIISYYSWSDLFFNLLPGLGRRSFIFQGRIDSSRQISKSFLREE
jgi:hypothetical protein